MLRFKSPSGKFTAECTSLPPPYLRLEFFLCACTCLPNLQEQEDYELHRVTPSKLCRVQTVQDQLVISEVFDLNSLLSIGKYKSIGFSLYLRSAASLVFKPLKRMDF